MPLSRGARRGFWLAGLAIVAVAGGTLAWGVAGLFDEPSLRARVRTEAPPEEPKSTPSARLGTTRIVLSEREVQGLVREHVPRALDLPISGVVAGLPGAGLVEAGIRLPARVLVDRGVPAVGRVLPGAWPEHPIWLVLALRPRVSAETQDRRRYLQLHVEEFRIGSRRLPVGALRSLLPADAVHWPLPRGVDTVTAERGRLILSGGS